MKWFAGVAGLAGLLFGLATIAMRHPSAGSPEFHPRSEAAEAREYFLLKRTGDPHGEIPMDLYAAAKARADRMPAFSLAGSRSKARSASADLGLWTQLGPGNVGGRSRALLIHPGNPDVMYAGATTGGVFKTTDGGRNWFPIADFFATLGIGAMTFDPGNPDVIYVGTGFWYNSLSQSQVVGSAPRGVGIYRTADGGVNWTLLPAPDGAHFRYINQIAVSPRDSQRLYAATWTGVFTSADGGENWTAVLTPRGSTTGCQSLALRGDTATDVLFAACGFYPNEPAAGIYRNLDATGGAAWQVVHQPRGMSNTTLAIAPSNPSVIYALSASNDTLRVNYINGLLGVFRSTANGDPGTWEARTTNDNSAAVNTALLSNNQGFFRDACFGIPRQYSNQGWIHNAIAVDPLDADRVYAGGIDIYRSDDGGVNWGIASFWQAADGRQGAHADLLSFAFHPAYDGAGNQALFVATDGGIYRTGNARAAVAGGNRAGCFPYRNEVSWEPLHNGYVSTQFYFGAVYPGGAAYMGGTQDNGTLRGTLANGGDWERVFGGDGAALAIDPADANYIYVSTPGFGLARSVNNGKTFDNATSGINDGFLFNAPLVIDPNQPRRLFAGGRQLWRSIDRAVSWTGASPPLPVQQGRISAIGVAPSDSSRLVMGTEQGFLIRNSRAVDSMADSVIEFAARPRTGFVASIAFDPENAEVVYAVYSTYKTSPDQHHVYRSDNGGFTWRGIDGEGDTGLPDIPVLSVLIDPANANHIYLGTDLGVFVSLDGGAAWMRDQSPFANVVTESLVLNRDTGVTALYAFTYGRGVWRTLLPGGASKACEYRVGTLPVIPALGGEAKLAIVSQDGCKWSVLPQNAAIDVLSPASGAGMGSVRVRVGPNPLASERTVGVWVQDVTVATNQLGLGQGQGESARAPEVH